MSQYSVVDVAVYIIENYATSLTFPKLHRLLYYCQAWHLVWIKKPLFSEKIEAWYSGPMIPEFYEKHKGTFDMSLIKLHLYSELDAETKNVVDIVARHYNWNGEDLAELSRREDPWKEARATLPQQERMQRAEGRTEITHLQMAVYYAKLAGSRSITIQF